MGRKKCTDDRQKRKAVRTTIELKKKIIAKFESGTQLSSLAKEFNMPRTTIASILKIKDAIKSAEVAKGVTILSSKRSPLFDTMEKLLLVWITEKQKAGDTVTEGIICEKAKNLYQDLQRDTATNSTDDLIDFKASSGWFRNFKLRTGMHCAVKQGQAASSNSEEARQFMLDFKNFVETEKYVPEQVFSCEETGLFWKKLPKLSYVTNEDKSLPTFQPIKDRLTLMLCGNASGDCKIKPLLIYNSENPRVFTKNSIIKSRLNVMWQSNNNAWVTRHFFLEWIHEVFAPSVKAYLEHISLPVKVLLLLNNAPAHPPGLEDILAGDYNFIRFKYLPPNIAPIIQPMDRQVISNFKKIYTKALLQRCFEVTSETELTLQEFLKNHFNILHCLGLIDNSWDQVTTRTLNSAWKTLWPECVSERDFDVFQKQLIVDEIVAVGMSVGLKIDSADVEELVKDHRMNLTTQELLDLHKEQEAVKEISSDDEKEDDGSVPSDEIQEWLSTWAEMQVFIRKWHPNISVVNQHISSFDDNVFGHFRTILKNRTYPTTINNFFRETSVSELSGNADELSGNADELSGNADESLEHQSLKVTLPDVTTEGDSSFKEFPLVFSS